MRLFTYIMDAVVRRPREELSRRQHQLRNAWDLAIDCGHQLIRHRAEGMAAELTYRTIFSLIPVVVLGLVLFRIFGGLDQVAGRVENNLFSFFGVPEIPGEYIVAEAESITDQVNQMPDASEGDLQTLFPLQSEEAKQQVAVEISEEIAEKVDESADDVATAIKARASIRQSLHEVTVQIASLDFASIGVIGLILFIYAAVALADSTEYLFNVIYDAPTSRPIHLRVAIHWSIITLGSGLLTLSLYMSGQVIEWFGTIGAGSQPIWLLQHVLSMLAGWVLLFLLYALMPNTRVSIPAAAIGSAVGAVLWEIAKYGFQIYVTTAVPYSKFYGSLGLIPLFLFWIYLTWLIVLFGLTLTATLQRMRGRRVQPSLGPTRTIGGDPDWMLPIMTEVATAFQIGKAISRQDLSDRLGLPSRIVHQMETALIEGGLLRRVAGESSDDVLTLAQPADSIAVARILELAHQSRPTNDHPAWRTLASLKLAEREAAAGKTLAELVVRG